MKYIRFHSQALNRTIATATFVLVTLTMTAQQKLIRINSTDIAWRKNNPQVLFSYKEKNRLLMPQNAAFGVECIPSFSPEWSLSYDSVAHTLVYKEAQKSIWYTTRNAMYKKKTKMKHGKKVTKRVLRKSPKDYVAPEVKTFSLPITTEQVQMLKTIWNDAVGTAVDRVDGTLDGTAWEYFIDGQQAKARREDNVLVKFTNELAEAVKAGDVSRTESLISTTFPKMIK